MLKPMTTDIEALKTLDDRLRWLSAWTIHHANHVRESKALIVWHTGLLGSFISGILHVPTHILVRPPQKSAFLRPVGRRLFRVPR